MKKRHISVGRVVHSSTAVAFVDGVKGNLRAQFELVLRKFFMSIGPNARGTFTVTLDFTPDRKEGGQP